MASRNKSSDLRSRIGQLLIIGFDGTEMSAGLESLLKGVQPAGVILFARNIAGAAQTFTLIQQCQSMVATPMFLCVDMEGGRVDRLRNVIGPAPAPAEVFATGDRKLFRKHGRIIGECCRTLGFNTDFAPSVDLAFAASRSVLSSRAVSTNPEEVVLYAGEFLHGLSQGRMLGCGKHFPGLGEGRLDSHLHLPIIEKTWKQLLAEDLYPYRALSRQFPFVMVSHAAFPAVTKDSMPASLSRKWISDVLRRKIGYRGLVISDDLEMGGVQAAMPTEQAAVEHIRAGGDIALICHQEELVHRAYELLLKEAESDRRFVARVAESVKRVDQQKKALFRSIHYRIGTEKRVPSNTQVEGLSRQLWEFSEQVRLGVIDRRERA